MPPIWVLKAWAWLQRNWRWVLFPIGIALLILGWTRRTNVTVASSTLIDADQNARKLADQAQAKTQAAKALEDVKILDAEHDFAVTVEAVQAAQKASAPATSQDPDAINRALLEAGRRQRGPS